MAKLLFGVSNHQVADSGKPPRLPDDFDTGPYYRAYFENLHGEQWLLWCDSRTKEVKLFSGDCEWSTELGLVRIDLKQFLIAAERAGLPELAGPILLAGMVRVLRLYPPDTTELVTLVLDRETGGVITCEASERIWLEACISALGSQASIETLADEKLNTFVQSIADRLKQSLAETEDDDSDEE
jgi:hypothetical protein